MSSTITQKLRLLATAALAAVLLTATMTVATTTPASADPPPASCMNAKAGVGCSNANALTTESCSGDANGGIAMYIPPTSLIGFLGPIITNVVNPVLNIVNPILCGAFSGLLSTLHTSAASLASTAGQVSLTPKTTALPVAGWLDPSLANPSLGSQTTGTFPVCGTSGYAQSNCYPSSGSTPTSGTVTDTSGTTSATAGLPSVVSGFSANDTTNTLAAAAQSSNISYKINVPLVFPNVSIVDIPATTGGALSSVSCPSVASGGKPSYKALLSGDPRVNILDTVISPGGLIQLNSLGVASSTPTVQRGISGIINLLGAQIPLSSSPTTTNSALGLVVAGTSADGTNILIKVGVNTAALLSSINPAGGASGVLSTTNLLGNVGIGFSFEVGPGGRATATSAEAWGTKIGIGVYFDVSLPLGLGYLGTGGLNAFAGTTPVPFDRSVGLDVKYGYSSCRSSSAAATTSTVGVTKAATPVGTGASYPTGTTAIPTGTKLDLKATVAPTAAAGTVQFYDGLGSIGSAVAVSAGVATLPAYAFADGTHTISAVFTPADQTKYSPSTSSPVTVTLGAAAQVTPPDVSQVGQIPPPNLK